MKTYVFFLQLGIDGGTFALYAFTGVIVLAILIFICRLVFSIDRRVRQNDEIIYLLTQIRDGEKGSDIEDIATETDQFNQPV